MENGMKDIFSEKFDVAVIGAGASGLMAAGRAAELGAKTVLIDRNDRPGRKLALTGGGRCNLANRSLNTENLKEKLGRNGRFLFSSLRDFSVNDTLAFFASLGVETRTEAEGRVFPISNRAEDVIRALENYLDRNRVVRAFDQKALGFETAGKRIAGLRTEAGIIKADRFVLAAGGKSYPATGSAGDGYAWLGELGHSVIDPRPVLVPLATKQPWTKELSGLSLRNVRVTAIGNDRAQASETGDVLFTHFGLSGPAILNISKAIGLMLKDSDVEIVIDFHPELELEGTDRLIRNVFLKNQNRAAANAVSDLVPERLSPILLRFAKIEPERKVHFIEREERRKLARLLKGLRFGIERTLGFETAMVTGGGASLKEVDPKTMRSKMIDNLFLAGEILDLDGPTGGYNLQIAWSTGRKAGESAAQ